MLRPLGAGPLFTFLEVVNGAGASLSSELARFMPLEQDALGVLQTEEILTTYSGCRRLLRVVALAGVVDGEARRHRVSAACLRSENCFVRVLLEDFLSALLPTCSRDAKKCR